MSSMPSSWYRHSLGVGMCTLICVTVQGKIKMSFYGQKVLLKVGSGDACDKSDYRRKVVLVLDVNMRLQK